MSIIQKIEISPKPFNEYTPAEKAVLEAFNKEIREKDDIYTVGDLVIDEDGCMYKILRFDSTPEERWYENGTKKDTPHYVNVNYVVYQRYYRDGTREARTDRSSLNDFLYRRKTKIFGAIEDLQKDVIKIITGETNLDEQEEEKISDSTDLVAGVNKEILEAHKRDLLVKRDIMEAKRRYMKGLMESKVRNMYSLVQKIQREVKKVMRVIHTLELFLGIHEELLQVQEGELAPENEPITFRQRMLYMDEEVGDPFDEGLDFKNIEDFDNWLTKYSEYYKKYNYELVMPETKGIVALRVRRSDKHYDDNPFINSLINDANKAVYILIRNGQNLYRIWSPNLSIADKLFPNRNELSQLNEEYQKTSSDHTMEEIDNKILDYKSHFVMLQGLLDRTDILKPHPENIRLLSPDALVKGYVKFVYEEENVLPPNRISFKEWLRKINSSLEEGCRIFSRGFGRWDTRDLYDLHRLKKYYKDYYNAPEPPGPGVFTVLEDPEWRSFNDPKDKKIFKFIYKASKRFSDEEYKQGVAFKLKDYDDFFINYDLATLEDIDFYLNNRLDRRFYLEMMPLLNKMKIQKLADLEQESHFVKLVAGQLIQKHKVTTDIDQLESNIKELVIWWKLKNKWKRAIESDNEKALRMIVKEYNSRWNQ